MYIPETTLKIPKWDNGRWLFPEQLDKRKAGFIYVIRDNYCKRFYLGKKAFKVRRGQNKGDESNWRKYNSSSPVLKKHFAERPIEEFDFIVLEQYNTVGTVSYAETWTACAVETPTTDDWYNTRIEKVSWKVREPISMRHKLRLNAVITHEDFRGERY